MYSNHKLMYFKDWFLLDLLQFFWRPSSMLWRGQSWYKSIQLHRHALVTQFVYFKMQFISSVRPNVGAEGRKKPLIAGRDAFLTTGQEMFGAPALIPAAGVKQLGHRCLCTYCCCDTCQDMLWQRYGDAQDSSTLVGSRTLRDVLPTLSFFFKGLGTAKSRVQIMLGTSNGWGRGKVLILFPVESCGGCSYPSCLCWRNC